MPGVRVLLIGAGALGTEVAMLLPLEASYHSLSLNEIHIVDFDTVEVSNLPRQPLVGPADVGMSKAKLVVEALQRRFSSLKAISHVYRVESMDVNFLGSFDAIFCTVDTVRTRRWINWVFCAPEFGRYRGKFEFDLHFGARILSRN